jgi:Fe2+ or Zn2+ uptake regulation protein
MLRARGLKATPARLAVLAALARAKRPMSAQAVIAALPRNADQATVYRTFHALKEKGLIRQIDLRHNHAHYEIMGDDEHHHLVCLHCGRVEDVHRCWIEDMQPVVLRRAKHFARITQHALEFYGVCRSCAAAHPLPSAPQKTPKGR